MKQELKNAYEKISTGTELRAGLIEIKNLLKEEKNRRELAYQLGGDFKVLTRCLSDGDPKVRKNAALVLGAMESDDLVRVLLNAYKKGTGSGTGNRSESEAYPGRGRYASAADLSERETEKAYV